MTTSSQDSAQFSGLILLTGQDKPGLAHALFEALSPFSVAVMDIDQIIIRDRLILTVQISLNPAHQSAIEEDLNTLAANLEVDIAAVFSTSATPSTKPTSHAIKITSAKLHPKYLMQIAGALLEAGGNIEDLSRIGSDPIEIFLKVSGISADIIQTVIAPLASGTEFSITNAV
jgi:phosphoserine phosphatase